MRRVVGLSSDELLTRERVFDGLVTKSVRRSLRAAFANVGELVTAASTPTLSTTPSEPSPTIPAGALGVVTATWSQAVEEELFPYLVQTFVDAAEDVYATMPETSGVAPKITYDLAAAYLLSASNRLRGIGDVVWSDMRTQLALGYEAGESIEQLATRLRTVAKISEPRALTIARTEVVPAANFGSLQQLKAVGFTDEECQKEWLATNDARTREAHREADGQRVGLSEPFHVGGDWLQVPGDPAGRADNVLKCRCSVAYVFDDDEDDNDEDEPLVAHGTHRQKDHGNWARGGADAAAPKSSFTILPKSRRGKSGDRMYAPGMWGRYGAAGLMMRHVDQDGVARYMVIQRSTGGYNKWRWQLPGGARDQNETASQAAARETFEELGYTQEQLDTLEPRGAHVVQLPVEGKEPWTYSSVVADAPAAFVPKIDYSELGAARWLTYDQLVEMRGRGRLVKPFAAQLEDIIAQFDAPVVAGFLVTNVTTSDDYRGYYHIMIGSKWTAADEAKIKRDSEGKFAKKTGVSLTPMKNLIDAASVSKSGDVFAVDKDAGKRARKSGSGFYIQKLIAGKWMNVSEKLTLTQLEKKLHGGDWKVKASDVDPNVSPPQGAKTTTAKIHTPLHINTAVIYKKGGYQHDEIVAEKPEQGFDPAERLVWDAGKKKFVLLERDNDGGWDPIGSYGKGDAYKKFSQETGWMKPGAAAVAVTAVAPPETKKAAPSLKDLAAEKQKVADKMAATPIVVKEMKEVAPKLGKPIHLNTTAIYKTKYADGTVVAEKEQAQIGQRLVWNAKTKKFDLQTRSTFPGGDPNWKTHSSYNKGEAYQKFSKETGWTHPIKKPPTPAQPAAPKKVSEMTAGEATYLVTALTSNELADKYDQAELDALNEKLFNAFKSGLITEQEAEDLSDKITIALGQKASVPQVADKIALPDLKKGNPTANLNWILGLTVKQWSDDLTSLQKTQLNDYVEDLDSSGFITANQMQKFQQIAGTSLINPTIANVLDNAKPHALKAWIQGFTKAQLEDYNEDELKAIDAKIIELLFAGELDYDAAKEASTKVNKALDGVGAVIPDFMHDSDDDVKSFYTGLTQDKFDDLSPADQVEVGKYAPSFGFTDKIDSLIAGKGDAVDVDADADFEVVDESKILMMTQPEYDALSKDEKIKLYEDAKKLADPTGAIQAKLEQMIKTHIAANFVNPSATSSPVVTPTVPTPITGSKWHVDVHGKIKKANDVSTPASPAPPPSKFKVLTPATAEATQQTMTNASGKPWTAGQVASIKKYTTSVGYRSMNAVLRDDPKQLQLFNDAQLNAAVKDAVNLQNAMKPLTDDVKLFRNVGTGTGTFGQNFLTSDIADLKKLEGQVITDKGFTSTTVLQQTGVSYDYATKPVFMIIKTPAGTPAVHADSAVPGHNEQEFILAAGTNFHIDEVRKATADDKAKYGNHVQYVVDTTVVPLNVVSSTPLHVPTTPSTSPSAPAVAPSVSITEVAKLTKPMKITTKVIHTTKYEHGAVVGYHKNVDGSLSRLAWSGTTKKFISQNYDAIKGEWVTFAGYGKGDAYQTFGKGAASSDWFAPPAGDSAIGTGGVFGTTSVAPKVSTSAPAPSTVSTSAPAAPVKQEKFDADTLIKQHGQVPATLTVTKKRELFDYFRQKTSSGHISLGTEPSTMFDALHATVTYNNDLAKASSLIEPLNMLQMLRLLDEQATARANAIAAKAGEPANKVNENLYEKKIVAWLQTPSGAFHATELLHPTPVAMDTSGVINPSLKYKSPSLPADVVATLEKIKPASSIGTPDPKATSFQTLSVAQAQQLQNQMLTNDPWTSTQKAALTKYSGSFYDTLNPVVRDLEKKIQYMGDTDKMTAARAAVNIQAGMRPLPQSVKVFRKTNPSQFPGLTDSAGFADVKKFEGKLFIDRAPLSTSVTQGTWSGKMHMEIDLPAGTPAAFIKSISQNPSEDEMLLALGLKYRVLSVTEKSGTIHVKMRVEA